MSAPGEIAPAFFGLAGSIDAIIYVARRDARRPLVFVSPAVTRFFGYAPEEWIEHPDSLGRALHPDDEARVRGDVWAWIDGGCDGPLHLKHRLVSKDGRVCWVRESIFANDELLAGAMVDVTELKVLQSTLEAVAGAAHPREAVMAFCDALAQALALESAGWSSPSRRESLVCSYGPLGKRLSAEWLDEGAPPAIASRALSDNCTIWSGRDLAAPVRGERGVQGALFGRTAPTLAASAHFMRIAEALAQQLAVALQRADLVRELEQLSTDRQRLSVALQHSIEEERSRLARELHDGAGQTLTAVAIQLDLAERLMPAEAQKPLAVARRQVERTLEDLRRLSHALRPAALDRLGLIEALRELCEALRSNELAVHLQLPAELKLPEALSTALFRIAQSALTNVVRHGRAKNATLRVTAGDGAVELEVRDDGRGFDPHEAPRSLGLLAMRERALALGGELSVATAPGEGCAIRAKIPVR